MKSLGALATHYGLEVQSTALLLKVTRTDAVALGFTTHDQALTYAGTTYSANGLTESVLRASAALSVDDLEGQLLIDDVAVTRADLLGGKYDYASIEIYRCNWTDTSTAELLFSGHIGQVSVAGDKATAEARSKTQALQQTIGRIYTKACDADFGDTRCAKSLTAITVTGTITSVTSQSVFTDTSRAETNNYFDYGLLTFTSGSNSGFAREVKSSLATGVLTVKMAFPYTVQVGDTYSLYPGCEKTTTDCQAYSNYINFRGFPHIIGSDQLMRPGGI